jgi:hypothetical protein
VVKSIEGLQQRLEDFSITEVSQAHKSAQTLTARLADLQIKLAHVAKIKQAVAASRSAVDTALSEWVHPDSVDTPEKPLRPNSFTQPSKLIIFPRMNKPAEASAACIGANALIPTEAIPPSRFEVLGDTAESANSEQSREESAAPQENDIAHFIPATALDIEPVREEPQFSEEASAAVAPQFEARPQQRQSMSPHSAAAAPDGPNRQTPAPTPEFDQRLLDDLIQNYGEFAGSSGPAAAIASSEQAPSTARISLKAAPNASDTDTADKQTGGVSKQSDIDRQLKNLIKNYGQYDIYSPKRRVSLKTGLIGASVLIGLLVSGFYYFSSKAANLPAVSSDRAHSVQGVTPAAESAGGAAALLAPINGDAPHAVSNSPRKTD